MASLGKEAAVTKESKLALIIGFVLVLVVGVLVSDHFSQANKMSHERLAHEEEPTQTPIASLGTRETRAIDDAFGDVADQVRANEYASRAQTPRTQPPVTIDNTNPGGSILDSAIQVARETVNNTAFPAAAETRRNDPVTIPASPQRLSEPEYERYTVKPGDSLIAIARRFLGDGKRYTEIELLNADVLGPDLVLQVGMTLKLPADAQIITLNDRGSSTTVSSSGGRHYTVKSGDTLGEISYKLLGTSKRMDEIVALNDLDSADNIFVGMTLKIPAK